MRAIPIKPMLPVVALAAVLAACLAGCPSGNSCAIPTGTTIAITRTNGSGNCPADVTAGIQLLNQKQTLAHPAACGMDHYNFTEMFTQQSGSGATCTSTDVMTFADLQMDGGSGSDVMTITCPTGVACTETYTVTFTPQ